MIKITTWPGKLAASWRHATSEAPNRENLDDPGRRRYLKSYLLLRVLIGAVGLSLPPVAWFFTALLPGGRWSFLPGELSDYYYSGMREYFTCSLAVIGLFLIAYKAFQNDLENWLTRCAGVAALIVAFFPTTPPADPSVQLNKIQVAFGVSAVHAVHYAAATLFIASLAVISYFFSQREGKRAPRPGHHSPAFWKRLHLGCAIGIGVAGGFYGVREAGLHYGHWVDAHTLWITEVVAVYAFATSWLAKGWEIRQLPRG